MANHVRRQLREALATALTGLTTTGARVFQSQSHRLADTDLPGLRIYTVSEVAQQDTIHGAIERAVEVRIEGVAQALADVDDVLDLIAKEVEVALGISITVAGATVYMEYTGCDIEFDTDAAVPTGQITMNYQAKLYTAAGAPDVFI